ncbi:cytochrome P450 [Sparassis crispa]|uniref:Cytochrome P450 n=1 Tax=Sparassis crispa TaxID=139825 RepID=A0A401H577_9APHY|nr:cytochrome P450 [Sparassis crispa]GBE89572.1 cytochrome P450 [Sparassis crispa]
MQHPYETTDFLLLRAICIPSSCPSRKNVLTEFLAKPGREAQVGASSISALPLFLTPATLRPMTPSLGRDTMHQVAHGYSILLHKWIGVRRVPLHGSLLHGFFSNIRIRRNKTVLPLPPGPPAYPIIGHLRAFSFTRQPELFREWTAKYGDIFHLRILGRNIVILNSLQVATDLMDKRGAKYSDRPPGIMFQLMGWDANITFMEYGSRWKKHRKIFRTYFSEKECLTYRAQQTRAAHVLLKDLLLLPHDFAALALRFAMRSLLEITYGHEVHSDNDIYVKLTEDALHGVNEAKLGASLVDLFPFLAYLPHWLPGCSSLTAAARRWRPATRKVHDYPFNDVWKQVEAGIAQPSFLSSHLERFNLEDAKEYDLDDLKGAAATILAGKLSRLYVQLYPI